MLGILTAAEIEEVLSSQIVGRIGCYADGKTYIVPVSYAYDGEYIYGHSKEGMKISMMRKNPQLCFQTDHFDNMANWESVIAWGRFEELSAVAERRHALEILLLRNLPILSSETVHLYPHWPFPPQDIDNIEGIVYRIKLGEKTGRFEKNQSTLFLA